MPPRRRYVKKYSGGEGDEDTYVTTCSKEESEDKDIKQIDIEINKYNDEYDITEIPIDENTYTSDIIEDMQRIFGILNNSINGIRGGGLLHKEFLKPYLLKKGGIYIDNIVDRDTLLTEIQRYSQELTKKNITAEKDIYYFLFVEKESQIFKDLVLNPASFPILCEYIKQYGNSKYGIIKHFKIKIHPIYNYLDLNRLSTENIYKSGNKDLLTKLSCYKYNEDVISAYQDPIFRDINNNNHIMDYN